MKDPINQQPRRERKVVDYLGPGVMMALLVLFIGQDSTDGGPKLPDTKSADGNSTDWSKVEIPKWNEFRLTKDGR